MMIVLIAAIAKDSIAANEGGGQGGFQIHGSGAPVVAGDVAAGESGLPKVLKSSKLPNFQTKTIGEAVDGYRYFTKREWKETPAKNGKVYVDVTGWYKSNALDVKALKDGISVQGVGIKFLVTPDGSYGVVMVSKVEIKTDGKMYSTPLPDIHGTLKMLYGNEEIRF